MPKHLILVDYENRNGLDLSALDQAYEVIIFVGVQDNEEKVKRKIEKQNRAVRVDYLKVDGYGRNALDFHIAFQLGRIYETYPETVCYILSADKGYDPLLRHLKGIGMECERVESLDDLPKIKIKLKPGVLAENPSETICAKCKKASTIEHNGGRWCTNCGKFASPPDPKITSLFILNPTYSYKNENIDNQCATCSTSVSGYGDGVYDGEDGTWTCHGCLGL